MIYKTCYPTFVKMIKKWTIKKYINLKKGKTETMLFRTTKHLKNAGEIDVIV